MSIQNIEVYSTWYGTQVIWFISNEINSCMFEELNSEKFQKGILEILALAKVSVWASGDILILWVLLKQMAIISSASQENCSGRNI